MISAGIRIRQYPKLPKRFSHVWRSGIRRTVEFFISFLSLILLAPVIIVLAILIRLSGKGPAIYSQERVGKNGTPFIIYKFRSMRYDAETGQPLLSNADDTRVTHIGRFMRKHRLDEIPNFINVMRGEMSLVGPRPERKFFIDQIIRKSPQYTRLFDIKPGMTGWGQVMYGYTSSVDEMSRKLEYDLFYLNNMSMLFDLKIIYLTLIIMAKGDGI